LVANATGTFQRTFSAAVAGDTIAPASKATAAVAAASLPAVLGESEERRLKR
jgi:hypothetical protein